MKKSVIFNIFPPLTWTKSIKNQFRFHRWIAVNDAHFSGFERFFVPVAVREIKTRGGPRDEKSSTGLGSQA